MLKKSCLLEYLITYAETLKKKDGKKALSANYFVISVLKTIEAIDNNQIPSEIDSEEAKKELAAVCDLLKRYDIDKNEAIEAISSDITSPEYNSFIDDITFGKIHQNAEQKAQKKGQDVIDTIVYLELIIAEPTASINKHVLTHMAQESASEEGSDTTAAKLLTEMQELLEGIDKALESMEEEEPQSAEASEETQSLSTIVKATRDIQSVLLENVFGQDQAVNTFVSGYFQAQLMSCSRKETKKPQATFLFAGPPGVGKTFLAEKVADALKLPYKRFDMSEYSYEQSTYEFCGTDKSYKSPRPGNVTGFVEENPKCVLLFDEIEKAHINVIHLFLQMLDAGRVRDNYTNEEVSFTDAVIILTTNVGKNLYSDPTIINLSAVPRKKILKALASDIDPMTNAPLFPAAICSRFASGNVVMFNHMEANNLYTIAKRELEKNVEGLEGATGVKIVIDNKVPSAIMFSEGGKADARTVKGRANAFFHEELYELFRLLSSSKDAEAVGKIKQINITVPLSNLSVDISSMFENATKSEVLVFASGEMATVCKQKLGDQVDCYFAETVDAAKEVLFNRDISVVLCDVSCGIKDTSIEVLNAEDINSVGHDFLTYVLDKYSLPVYILQVKDSDISQEEFLSFAKVGVATPKLSY